MSEVFLRSVNADRADDLGRRGASWRRQEGRSGLLLVLVLASTLQMASASKPLIRSQSEHISGRGVPSNAAVFPPLAAKEASDPAVLVIDGNGEMVQLTAAKAASVQGPRRYPQHWRRAPKTTRAHGTLTEVFRESFTELPGALSQDSFRQMQLLAAAAPVVPVPATVPAPVAPAVAPSVGVAAPVAPLLATAPPPALAATAAPLLTATPAPVAGAVVTPAPVPGAVTPLAAAVPPAAPTAAKDDSQGGSGIVILIVFLLLGTLAIAAFVLYKKRLGNAAGGRLGGVGSAGAEDPLVWKSSKVNKSTYRKAVLSENKTSQDTEDSDEDSSAKPSGEDQKSTAKSSGAGRGAAAKASRAGSREGDDAAAAAGSTASEKELGSTGGSVTGTAYRSYKDRRAKS